MNRIDQFIESALAARSDQTKRSYRYSLERFAAHLAGTDGSLVKLTRIDVQSYVSYLQTIKKLSASSILREFAAVAAFARWTGQQAALVDIRLPQAPKIAHVAPKSLIKTERSRLLRDVERDGNARNIALVNLLIRTGLRVSELVSLDRDNVVLGAREETSYIRVIGKRSKERKIPLSSEARLYLKRYLDARQDEHPALFVTDKGAPERLSVRSVQHICSRYGVHPHELRHSRARSLVEAGVDLPTVAEILGHSSIEMTRRYTKPGLDDMVAAMDRAEI